MDELIKTALEEQTSVPNVPQCHSIRSQPMLLMNRLYGEPKKSAKLDLIFQMHSSFI